MANRAPRWAVGSQAILLTKIKMEALFGKSGFAVWLGFFNLDFEVLPLKNGFQGRIAQKIGKGG